LRQRPLLPRPAGRVFRSRCIMSAPLAEPEKGGERMSLDSATQPIRRLVVAALVCLLVAPAVHAQEYPVKPIRLIVPTAAGGGTDLSARMIAPKLSQLLGQQVIVENIAGGNTAVGNEYVAKAAPDGYVLLMGISSITINPHTQIKVPYDPV